VAGRIAYKGDKHMQGFGWQKHEGEAPLKGLGVYWRIISSAYFI
jgi:hypothetical protein